MYVVMSKETHNRLKKLKSEDVSYNELLLELLWYHETYHTTIDKAIADTIQDIKKDKLLYHNHQK